LEKGLDDMGLFEKKFCDLCGEKVNILTRQKLSDGFLCSDCKHKLSDLSSGWSDRTLEDVKKHLQQREENKTKYSQFSQTSAAGRNSELIVDVNHGWFVFAYGKDYSSGNPEVFNFSQLTDFWIDEDFSISSADSDGDGIPDNRDNFNNVTGNVTNNSFGGMFGMNNMNNMGDIPMNAQQYIHRNGTYNSDKTVTGVIAVFHVSHPYINEVKIRTGSSFDNNRNEIYQAYTYAAQMMYLCEQIKGSSMQQNQGFGVQQGFNTQTQPMQRFQQPVQQSQAPISPQVDAAASVMPFCPSCGAQNTSGASFCPSCGTPLKK
jgi:hypothetical protein